MQLVVLCVVLAYLCFVTATPHGYGVKGGAAAKAEASAAAGAYSGLAGVPPIPFGPGFSGSFTKSASSSSASSSASSSSSSFSFSGSGHVGGSGGCATGSCPNSGSQDQSGYHNAAQHGGSVNGNQNSNYNLGIPHSGGAYSGAAAQAGAIAGSQQYFGSQNNPSCTGNNCFEKQGECKGPHCSADYGTAGKKCESGKCSPASAGLPSSSDDENINNCESGQCGSSSSAPGTIPTSENLDGNKNQSPNECLSGKCDTTAPQACFGAQCSPSSTIPNTLSGLGSNESPHSEKGTNSFPATIPSSTPTLGYNSNPHSHSTKQGIPSADNSECTSGQCNPSLSGNAAHSSSDSQDIAVNIQKNSKSKSNVNNEANDYEKSIDTSKGDTNCAYGNCASNPTSNTPYNNPGTHPYSSLNTNVGTSKCNSPDCKNNIYNHAAAAGGASASSYNKPAIYLTTPKQTSCTTPNCKPADFALVQQTGANGPYDDKKPFGCAAGQCGNNQPNSYFPSSNTNSPTTSYGFAGKCTSPNCASTPQQPSSQIPHGYNVPNVPSYKPPLPQGQGQYSSPVHNLPNSFGQHQGSSPSYTPSIPNNSYHPNQSPSGSNQIQATETKVPAEEEPFPPFVILTTPSPQPCGANGCSGGVPTKPNFGTTVVGTQSNIYSGLSSSPPFAAYPSSAPSGITTHAVHSTPSHETKPSHDGRDKPVYTGGFGGPAGLLKPNDYRLPSSIPVVNKPGLAEKPSATCSTGSCDSTGNHVQIQNGIPASGGIPASSGIAPSNGVSASFGVTGVSHNAETCTSGKCGPHDGTNNGPHAGTTAGAAASGLPAYSGIPAATGIAGGIPNAAACTSGKCGTGHNGAGTYHFSSPHAGAAASGIPSYSGIPTATGIPGGPHNAATCTSGKCGAGHNGAGTNLFNGAHAAAGAAASANAIIYTGGFGGPPGFLKPYDGGNVKGLLSSFGGKGGSLDTLNGGSSVHGSLSNNNGAGGAAQAFASAVAGASAGAFGGNPGHYTHNDGSDSKAGRGCDGGCPSSGTGANGSGLNSQYNAGLSLAKAGAVSGANAGSFGLGGSYASSSASAHASAGAAVKGYGRR